MRTPLLWLLPLAALSALAGCSSGGGGACGGLVWSADPACQACMHESCCATLAACDVGTPCGRLATCVLRCAANDTACTDQCINTEPTGVLGLDAVSACYDTNCRTNPACETNVCGTKIVISDAACGACLSEKCCGSWEPCAKDAACGACLTAEPRPLSCDDDALYLAASECFLEACGTACAATICDSNLGTAQAACNVCLGKPDAMGGCCETTKLCKADPGCYGCITGKNPVGCDTNASFQMWSACVDAQCAASCVE